MDRLGFLILMFFNLNKSKRLVLNQLNELNGLNGKRMSAECDHDEYAYEDEDDGS